MGKIIRMERERSLRAEYAKRDADLKTLCALAFERGFIARATAARAGVEGVTVEAVPYQTGGKTSATGMAYARGWRAASVVLLDEYGKLDMDCMRMLTELFGAWILRYGEHGTNENT